MLLFLALIDKKEDRDKFEILYGTYQKKMWYVAHNILKNASDAEDAVQNAFLKVARNMHKIGDPLSKKTKYYLICAAEHIAFDMQYRKSYKKHERSFDLERYDMIPDEGFEDKIINKMLFENVVKAIINLKPIYSNVLYYYFVFDLGPTEISKILGINTGTISSRIYRGKQELIYNLNSYGSEKSETQ